MNEILQSVLDSDYVSFNEKFKEKLKTNYDGRVETIKGDVNKTIFKETMKINDGTAVVKCENCGAIMTPGIPMMGACPECGTLLTD